MSSNCSGDADYDRNSYTAANERFSSSPVQRGPGWVSETQYGSGKSSILTCPSPTGSHTDLDLDLDSLFKRLDQYTSEMDEVEARLRRLRRVSQKPDRINIKSFSFDARQMFGFEEAFGKRLAPLRSTKLSRQSSSKSRKSTGKRGSHVQNEETVHLVEDGGSAPLIIQSHASSVVVSASPRASSDSSLGAIKEIPHQEPTLPIHSGGEIHIPDPDKGDSDSGHETTNDPKIQRRRQSLPVDTCQLSPSLHSQDEMPVLDESFLQQPQKQQQQRYQEQYNHSGDLEYSDLDEPGPSVPTSWILPPRTSSKTLIVEEQAEEVDEISPKPPKKRKFPDNRQTVRHCGIWSAPSLRLLDQEPVPPLPSLSQSGSITTLRSSPPLTPHWLCCPQEDQLRRELESFALQDGAETLALRYKQRRPPTLNLINSDDEDFEIDEHKGNYTESDWKESANSPPSRPRPRRSKSIMSIFQRKSPVEKVIDLYFDEEPEEKPRRSLSRWATRGSFTTANVQKSPRVPPLPQASPGLDRTSFG